MKYDVIIAGAGPSGTTMAYHLARAGLEVLVLEKEFMPREKPCGGGVTYKAARLLEFPWEGIIEDTIQTVVFTFRGRGRVSAHSAKPVAYMITRSNFDSLLTGYAKLAGANIVEGTAVREVTVEDNYVSVRVDGEAYRGRFFVGADGINGKSARLLGLHGPEKTGPTLEVEVECPSQILEQNRGVIKIDGGAVPGGYGWVFPKKDHLSIGLGVFTCKVKGLRHYLNNFLVREGLDSFKVLRVQGFPIPISGGKKRKIHYKSALLLGDAAGLVDPFCGEGIYYAIKSAQLATEAILDNKTNMERAPSIYQKLVDKQITVELAMARKLAKVFYAFPQVAFNLIERNPDIAGQLCKIIYGDGSFAELKGAAIEVIRTITSSKKAVRAQVRSVNPL